MLLARRENGQRTAWNYLTTQLTRTSEDEMGDPDLFGERPCPAMQLELCLLSTLMFTNTLCTDLVLHVQECSGGASPAR